MIWNKWLNSQEYLNVFKFFYKAFIIWSRERFRKHCYNCNIRVHATYLRVYKYHDLCADWESRVLGPDWLVWLVELTRLESFRLLSAKSSFTFLHNYFFCVSIKCLWVKIPEIYQELTPPSDFVPTFRIPSRGHKMMIWVEKKKFKNFHRSFFAISKKLFFVLSKYVNLLSCITHPILLVGLKNSKLVEK